MYGLPDQTPEQWAATLATALGLRPSHISMYCLTLEGGTPMERDAAAGRIPVPDGDLAADMYLMAEVQAADAGYRHYEISNWAIPGRESRHNLLYWRNHPFLGVGPARTRTSTGTASTTSGPPGSTSAGWRPASRALGPAGGPSTASLSSRARSQWTAGWRWPRR